MNWFLMVTLASAVSAQSGVQSQPPTGLAQFQSNGTMAISEGGEAWSMTLVLSGIVHGTVDPTPPRHFLQVEVRPISQSFLDSYTHQASGLVTIDQTSAVTVSGLMPAMAYHWQARTGKT